MQKNTSSLSRRKVTAGLAWSVPAVAAVAAAPFAAASHHCPTVTGVGNAVKYPGTSKTGLKQAYGFPITVTNTTDDTILLTPGDVTVKFDKKDTVTNAKVALYSKSPCDGGVPLTEEQLTLAPGESLTLFYVANETGNSANDGGCIDGNIRVELVGGTMTDSDCGTVTVPRVCFSETPPSC